MNPNKPGKSKRVMMLLSLLRVQDNNILPKWYEETTRLYFVCPEDGDQRMPSQHTSSYFCLCVKVICCHSCFALEHRLLFYNYNYYTFVYNFAKQLQEFFATSSMQALVDLLPISLQVSTGSEKMSI